jgi:hypothetical protein
MSGNITDLLFKLPDVTSGKTLTNTFLDNVVELAIVTDNHKKTMEVYADSGLAPGLSTLFRLRT